MASVKMVMMRYYYKLSIELLMGVDNFRGNLVSAPGDGEFFKKALNNSQSKKRFGLH